MNNINSQKYVIDVNGLEEEIRCIICENPMHTDRGCDGNCKYNEHTFREIIQLLDRRIKLLPYEQQNDCNDCINNKPSLFIKESCKNCSRHYKDNYFKFKKKE